MTRIAKKVLLTFVALFSINALFAQTRFARPVTLPDGASTKTINVEFFSDGSSVVVDDERTDKRKDRRPNANIIDTKRFLLINGTWMETTAANNGDMKFGDMIFPFDGVQFNDVRVSDANNLDSLEKHQSLPISLKCIRTEFKYKDTLDLNPNLKDSILRISNEIVMRCGEKEGSSFDLIINDTILVKDQRFLTGVDITLSGDQLTKLEIPSADQIKEEETILEHQIVAYPQGCVPSFIKSISLITKEDRSSIPPAKPKTNTWVWILIGALLLIVGVATLLFLKKRRNSHSNEENEENDKQRAEESKDYDDDEESMIMPLQATPRDAKEETKKLIEEARQQERNRAEKRIASLEEDVKRLENDLKDEKVSAKKRVDDARDEERRKAEKQISSLKDEVKKLEDDLKEEKTTSRKRIEEAREDEHKKAEKQIAALKEDVKTLESNLKDEKAEAKKRVEEAHEEEQKIAKQKIDEINENHKSEVDRLEAAQKVYSDKIAFVPFASQYAKDIYALIDTVNNINKQAKELLKAEVENDYQIYKAIGKFNMAQSEIDYESFLIDVSLAAKNDMSFTNSGITNLKTVSQDQLFNSLRSYFLSAYLEKYINAAVVYNESLAGVHRLVAGMDASMTEPFQQYREKLKECCKRLGIAVISVKLFDIVGDNIDLKATMVNFDESLPADSILAIENCLVYPEGGRRPMDKIYVKAQK